MRSSPAAAPSRTTAACASTRWTARRASIPRAFPACTGTIKPTTACCWKSWRGVEDRGAHYTCAIALVWPDGKMLTAEDYLYGEIAHDERGTNGFGYDPLFILPERGLRTAEISAEEKNRISHRGKALRRLVEKLEAEQQ